MITLLSKQASKQASKMMTGQVQSPEDAIVWCEGELHLKLLDVLPYVTDLLAARRMYEAANGTRAPIDETLTNLVSTISDSVRGG